eukprot:3503085-Alexandrium_andersonii.AAC.1
MIDFCGCAMEGSRAGDHQTKQGVESSARNLLTMARGIHARRGDAGPTDVAKGCPEHARQRVGVR